MSLTRISPVTRRIDETLVQQSFIFVFVFLCKWVYFLDRSQKTGHTESEVEGGGRGVVITTHVTHPV